MSEQWKAFSDELADAAEMIGQSVVRVEGRRRFPATGIVWSADGLIVTAHHVLHRDEDISVGLPGGETVAAELVGRDPATDLALLRVEADGLAVPTWAETSELRPGELVLALGRPGKGIQASLGALSVVADLGSWLHRSEGAERTESSVHKEGAGRHSHRGRGPRGRFGRSEHRGHSHMEHASAIAGRLETIIRPDLVMYPGFSGGPLVRADGTVAGMNTSALLRMGALTVPAAMIRVVGEALQTHGRVRQGYLGVSSQVVRLPDALQDELDQQTGLLIVQVLPDSPAERAGLLLGDVITSFDGVATETLDDLITLLSGDRVGSEVEVRVLRGGEMASIYTTVAERA